MSMMGNLAALDGYDPNAEFPPLPVDDAFTAAAARTAGPYRAVQERAGTSPLQNAPSAVMGALAAPFTQTNQLVAKNPYPEGSEEASFYEDQRLKNSASFGEKTALGLLGVGAPMAMTGVVPHGAVAGMFGGKLAETADLAALRKAQRLEKAGTEPGAVLDTTGWEKRPDKQWRFEINDRDSAMQPAPFAHMRMNAPRPTDLVEQTLRPDVTAGEVFRHPELYAAYPEIANMPVRRIPSVNERGELVGLRGAYDPKEQAFYLRENLSPEEARLTLLHEAQHAVQQRERFGSGGSLTDPVVVKRGDRQLDQRISAAEQRFITLRDQMLDELSAKAPSGNPTRPMIDQWKKDNPALAGEMDRAFDAFSSDSGILRNQSRFEAYRTLQGETEARNVAKRADLIPEQRYLLRPEVTEDVARAEQWVNRQRSNKMGDVAVQDQSPPGMMMSQEPPRMGGVVAQDRSPLWQHAEDNTPRNLTAPGDLRASTRFPTAVKATENPLTQQLSIGLDEMRASPGFEHNIGLLSNYPGFARLKGMNPEEAARAYIDQAAGNMQYLYNRAPQVMKERTPLWYEGAHEISDALAKRWGVPRQSSSAALASLSPQKDWFMNASLGERVGDTLSSAGAGRILTPEMRGFGEMKGLADSELFRSIIGKKLDQLETPAQKAMWIRLHDEAHNPRAYRTVTPEGRFGDFVTTQSGAPANVAWGTFGDIAKAVGALESGGNMNIISPLLGEKHKVRSFYNNIELPHDRRFGDVTADTHQVAAAQMRPLSGKSPAVAHNLQTHLGVADQPPGWEGSRASALTGVQGTYGLVADATRQMAASNNMIPRAAQSATWEPVRELFPAKFKTAKNNETVDAIWRSHDRGEISLERARDQIFELAGGIGEPSWARPGARTFAPAEGSTYR